MQKLDAAPTLYANGNTIGKDLHFASIRSLRSVLDESILPPLLPANKSQHLWSSLSSCGAPEAWECLFGKPQTQCGADEDVQQVFRQQSDEDVVAIAGALAVFLAPSVYHLEKTIIRVHNAPSPTPLNISVHARFGDACDYVLDEPRDFRLGDSIWGPRGRPCFHPKVYFKALERASALYNTVNVIVATDSQDFLDEMLLLKQYNFVYVSYPGRSKYNHGSGWIEQRHDLDQHMADASITDLYILQYGQVFVGGLFGHMSNAAYLLMVGRAGVALPFISVDGGGLLKTTQPAEKDLFDFAQRRRRAVEDKRQLD